MISIYIYIYICIYIYMNAVCLLPFCAFYAVVWISVRKRPFMD